MADADHPAARWLRRMEPGGQPIYRALVEALAAAVRAGELQPGDRLPPQRTVAELVGVDLTTVTRAYAAARAQGLIEGTVGRGTFVRAGASEDEAGLVDLSMNLPPPPDGLSLGDLLAETTAAILRRTDPQALMAYHPAGGALGQRTAAAAWLKPLLGEVAPERLLISPGAQTGLAAVLATVCRPGDVLIVEPLVYPGLLSAAAALGVRLAVCAAGGLDPDALGRLAAQTPARAIYLIPTTQNPTAATLDVERRRAIVEIARAHDLWIIEDDPYSRLFDAPPPAVASLAPERTFHLATLSKTLSPGLRTAYLLPPPGEIAARTAETLRAVGLMPAPLMAAVAAAWIREGDAERLLAGVRREARARRAIAAEILPQARGAAEGLHVWLDLPPGWPPARLHQAAQARGLSLVAADAFAAGPDHPNGLRISLGGPSKRTVLATALHGVAALLAGEGPPGRVVV
ncbi:MAG: PLP-dependent aminotransferase family protein [Caulobacterales bacterium]|nr:PLP-dependent aminotransferase family protein [Caulobacterales bacterium]